MDDNSLKKYIVISLVIGFVLVFLGIDSGKVGMLWWLSLPVFAVIAYLLSLIKESTKTNFKNIVGYVFEFLLFCILIWGGVATVFGFLDLNIPQMAEIVIAIIISLIMTWRSEKKR